MIFSKETYIHDAELDIVVPNGTLDFKEENIDDIIYAKKRNQIFYDEFLHAYLVTTLPLESNFENKEEATEFFKKLEVKLQATLVDTPNFSNLAVPTNYYSPELSRTSSSSSTASSISGIFSSNASVRSDSTSPSTPGSPTSDYSFKRLSASKVIEGTVIHSAQYDSKNNNNNEMVVVKREGCWISVLPLSFPIALKTRAHNQIALDVTVTQSRKMKKSPESGLYSPENFGMNLLGGLSDDPAFAGFGSLNFSIPTYQEPVKKSSIYSTLPLTPIKRCKREILSIKPTLTARIRSTYVSPLENTVMISVELENDTENEFTFSIEDLKVEIAHGIATKFAWGPQDTSNDKLPITLRPSDQVNFLYNVTILEDSSFPEPLNTQQYYPTPVPHSKTSSRRESVASINSTLNPTEIDNTHRTLSVIVEGCPIIDGVKSLRIESKWNCELDISTLFKNDSMASSQLREVEDNKYMPTMCNNKFNCGIEEEINTFNTATVTATTIRDSFSSNNVKNYDSLNNIEYGNDSSNVGIEINVNGVNVDKKRQSGYVPDTNLLNVNDGNDENNGILTNGRLLKLQKQKNLDSNVCNGVSVSFEVCGKPVVGKVFTVKAHIVNKSKHVRRFTIMAPNKRRPNEKLFNNNNHRSSIRSFLSQSTDTTLVDYEDAKQPLGDPFMDETILLRKHFESETPDASLICLDNEVRVGPIEPYESEYATLHFISTKEELQMVELVQLVDDDTRFMTNLRNVVQVDVAKNEKKMKRMNRISHNSYYNPVALRHIEVTG